MALGGAGSTLEPLIGSILTLSLITQLLLHSPYGVPLDVNEKEP